MNFEKNDLASNIGEKSGFFVAYIIFTTVVFSILFFSKKASVDKLFYVILITALITLFGVLLRRWLR